MEIYKDKVITVPIINYQLRLGRQILLNGDAITTTKEVPGGWIRVNLQNLSEGYAIIDGNILVRPGNEIGAWTFKMKNKKRASGRISSNERLGINFDYSLSEKLKHSLSRLRPVKLLEVIPVQTRNLRDWVAQG